jgi:4-hydroxy-3-methylbut-2-enyl diphosphate reductase IspH
MLHAKVYISLAMGFCPGVQKAIRLDSRCAKNLGGMLAAARFVS